MRSRQETGASVPTAVMAFNASLVQVCGQPQFVTVAAKEAAPANTTDASEAKSCLAISSGRRDAAN
jgi:hypothetical protein